jgi:TM2 domain-containing membrane protein YozV
MLNLAVYEPVPNFELTRPDKHRRPVLALVLSMVFPGLGHLYIGLRRNAAWIMGMEALCLLFLLSSQGALHANSVLAIPVLYCFAMTDAFFSARESNAGATPLLIGANPRIAAVLNLLTKGFGYFYLGDRTKGIVCFVLICAIQAALLMKANVWTSILAITVQIAIALDGYRVARQRLHAAHPELAPSKVLEDGSITTNVVDQANLGGLNPSIALSFFVVFGAIALMGYCAMRALDGHAVHSHGTLEDGPDGTIYRDSKEKIVATLPGEWSPQNSADFLLFMTGKGTSLILQEQFATSAAAGMLAKTEADIKRRHPDATSVPCQTRLGKHSASCLQLSFRTPKVSSLRSALPPRGDS